MHGPSARLEALRQEIGEALHESIADREGQVVRNVVLLGPQSRNGYRYTSAAMEQAAPLYDGRPIFLDHVEGAGQPTRRKLRDFAGQVVQPRLERDRLRGDLKLLGPHTQWLFDLIEAAPRDIGMSHVVVGRRAADGRCVEHIERVISVDIVAFPATTASFREGSMAPEWVTELVEQSKIAHVLRCEGMLEALAVHPQPDRLLRALEVFAERMQRETPVSSGKNAVGDGSLSLGLRQSLIAAVRGRAN
jgi:hypothetical protein